MAPAHPSLVCAGVFVLLASFGSACEKGVRLSGANNRTLVLSGDTVELEPGVTLHDVAVKAVNNADFDPVRISARVGDIVRFTSRGTRTHALAIAAPTPEATALLDSSAQRRSPPLVSEGQAWVISLKGWPAGTYTVSCLSHAGTATLLIQ